MQIFLFAYAGVAIFFAGFVVACLLAAGMFGIIVEFGEFAKGYAGTHWMWPTALFGVTAMMATQWILLKLTD